MLTYGNYFLKKDITLINPFFKKSHINIYPEKNNLLSTLDTPGTDSLSIDSTTTKKQIKINPLDLGEFKYRHSSSKFTRYTGHNNMHLVHYEENFRKTKNYLISLTRYTQKIQSNKQKYLRIDRHKNIVSRLIPLRTLKNYNLNKSLTIYKQKLTKPSLIINNIKKINNLTTPNTNLLDHELNYKLLIKNKKTILFDYSRTFKSNSKGVIFFFTNKSKFNVNVHHTIYTKNTYKPQLFKKYINSSNYRLLFDKPINLNKNSVPDEYGIEANLSTVHNKNYDLGILGAFIFKNSRPRLTQNIKLDIMQNRRMYSFLKKNQYRKSFYDFKKKQLSRKYVNIFKNLKTSYSFEFMKNNIFYISKINSSLGLSNRVESYNTKTYNSLNTTMPLFEHREPPVNNNIQRIKFKPGYQRIWRHAREIVKTFFGVKFIYQQQLTKFLRRYYLSSGGLVSNHLEKNLSRTILSTRLLPDEDTIKFFNKKSFIYFNGSTNLNLNTITIVGDLIQLIVSFTYYASYRWMVSITSDRLRKFKRLVYRKGMAYKYKLIKNKKQKSYHIPSWVTKYKYVTTDIIKSYLEVDYMTLSALVVHDQWLMDKTSTDDKMDIKLCMVRMYNWKYIN